MVWYDTCREKKNHKCSLSARIINLFLSLGVLRFKKKSGMCLLSEL